MMELLVIVPVVLIVSANGLAVAEGRKGDTAAHVRAFSWGLASLISLPLSLVAFASAVMGTFKGQFGFALIVAALFGLGAIFGSVLSLVNLRRAGAARAQLGSAST